MCERVSHFANISIHTRSQSWSRTADTKTRYDTAIATAPPPPLALGRRRLQFIRRGFAQLLLHRRRSRCARRRFSLLQIRPMAAGGSVENARPGRMWLLGQTALGYRSIAVCWCLCVCVCARFIDAESTPPRRSYQRQCHRLVTRQFDSVPWLG